MQRSSRTLQHTSTRSPRLAHHPSNSCTRGHCSSCSSHLRTFSQLGLESWSGLTPKPIYLFGLMLAVIRQLVVEWASSCRVPQQRRICIRINLNPHVLRAMSVKEVDTSWAVPTSAGHRASIFIINVGPVCEAGSVESERRG